MHRNGCFCVFERSDRHCRGELCSPVGGCGHPPLRVLSWLDEMLKLRRRDGCPQPSVEVCADVGGQVRTPVPTMGIVLLLRVACRGGPLRPPVLRLPPIRGGIVPLCDHLIRHLLRKCHLFARRETAPLLSASPTFSPAKRGKSTSRGRLSRFLRGISEHKRTVPLCYRQSPPPRRNQPHHRKSPALVRVRGFFVQ